MFRISSTAFRAAPVVRRMASAGLSRPSSAAFSAGAEKPKQKLVVFDTTLRDGEQSPGATLNTPEKLAIAKQLSRLGVDVAECGFPIASPGDFEAVQLIAKEVGGLMDERRSDKPMRICGLARALEGDIERCYAAVSPAPLHRIHTFLATSPLHLKHKLKLTQSQCVEQVSKMVRFAKSLLGPGGDLEFSAEDAGRSELAFLAEVYAAAIEAGATTLNVPDTVGYTIPQEYRHTFEYLAKHTKGFGPHIVLSTHCHNDLGLATANTLAAVQGGARQVEVTINGIGERAGNTSLEEVVMTLLTRPHLYPVQVKDISSTHLMRCSTMVSTYTGMIVQPNKAIVGANAFAHEAGIHQDGVLKNPQTYEIMTPESVGIKSSLVLGKHSGRNALGARLTQLGYELNKEELNKAFKAFKVLADKKKEVTDLDLEAIAAENLVAPESADAGQTPQWTLQHVHVTSGSGIPSSATVSVVSPEGKTLTDAASGVGSVDSVFKAVSRIIKQHPFTVGNYTVQSVNDETSEAVGRVSVRISPANALEAEHAVKSFTGHGAHIDILVASTQALLNALNKMIEGTSPKHVRQVQMPGKGFAGPQEAKA